MTNVLISLLILSPVKFLTALQSGGWVPWTSMSFHYWQPAHWWDCSHGRQILATQPWAPMQRGRRAPLTLLIIYNRHSRNKGGCGGGNNPETMLEHRMAVHERWGIDMPLLTQSTYVCTDARAWTNTLKCKGQCFQNEPSAVASNANFSICDAYFPLDK